MANGVKKRNLIDKLFVKIIYDFFNPESNPYRIFLALKTSKKCPVFLVNGRTAI